MMENFLENGLEKNVNFNTSSATLAKEKELSMMHFQLVYDKENGYISNTDV